VVWSSCGIEWWKIPPLYPQLCELVIK